MAKNKKKKQINKRDYCRVLVTETLPYETPIIFSNEGLYRNVVSSQSANGIMRLLVDGMVRGEKSKKGGATIPYSYKIRKNATEFRRLGLVHPISQWKIKEFYERYERAVLHYCAASPASIRSPHKIASTFYTKSSWENISQYKTGGVSEAALDQFAKHSPSFFAYRGHDRLYKFFDSPDFLSLEKAFGHLWTLDVSKCFDSIYTHCLSWATKDKDFTKAHVSVESTFGQAFDSVMRHANHNETNGIVIGPEVSRVFAEIVFQAVDGRVITKLREKYRTIYGEDYEIRRYVDDVFIFSSDEEVARQVFECYRDMLVEFNLHVNSAKSQCFRRPFVTKKSRIIRDANRIASEFLEKFIDEVDGTSKIVPKKIFHKWKLTRSFVESVKAICSYNDVAYDEVSSYLVSAFTERVKKLANADVDSLSDDDVENYRDCGLVLLDVLFFLYSVSPSVSASYKLATSIIVLIRFFDKKLIKFKETVRQKIYDLTNSLLSHGSLGRRAAVEGFTWLEASNILLASRELGENYLLSEEVVAALFDARGKLSYFDITCGLFYVRKEPKYRRLRRLLVRAADSGLKDLSDIFFNSEKVHLFLDLITCPYVYHTQRRRWISRIYTQLKMTPPSTAELDKFLEAASKQYWFVNWTEVDLLNSLEKKELKRAY
ncbi:antiviral reverse transcriptase Drt3b [Burkholderia vietnamiensis]|uniref:antiviral reverse transcriptase Drt3b n=1 Tax=Burkholderia vietnamiensis TaxID=60552 RepID=UPI002013A8F1|nr:antiviral reverse transcriptase Drt3b [Burkholderia vietnamiensis]